MKNKTNLSEKDINTSEGADDDPGQVSPESNNQNSLFKKIRSKIFKSLLPKTSRFEEEVVELLGEINPDGLQINPEGRNILHNVFNLGEVKVSDVMIPRTDIIGVEDDISLERLKETLIKNEHTRMPVFHSTLDNVLGFIHIKDFIPILGTKKNFVMKDMLREILFVPPSMKIIDLLYNMKSKRVHMAIVLDEYGGTDGLVTLEDIMEAIVGDIEDEHDENENVAIIRHNNGDVETSARIEIEELEKFLGIQLKPSDSEDDFETVGGLIFFITGRVPEKGEVVRYINGLEFHILEADPRRIEKVLIKKSNDE